MRSFIFLIGVPDEFLRDAKGMEGTDEEVLVQLYHQNMLIDREIYNVTIPEEAVLPAVDDEKPDIYRLAVLMGLGKALLERGGLGIAGFVYALLETTTSPTNTCNLPQPVVE
jgi:hypothetical protein